MKQNFHADGKEKRAGVAILITEKIDLGQKLSREIKNDFMQ